VLAAPVMSRPGFAAYQTGADKMPHGTVVDPRVFVAIAPDGIVTIVAHRAEMGTGVRTSLPMIVAEEMEADWSRVRVQQAHGDEVKFGNQDTDGSRSTRHYLIPMRQIGASARTMLEAAAAKRWGVPATEVKAVNHEVLHNASGRRMGFGDLATDAAKESVPSVEGLRLKDPKDFRYLGKGQISIVDLRDITVGTARYGADVRLPGMKYAVIARNWRRKGNVRPHAPFSWSERSQIDEIQVNGARGVATVEHASIECTGGDRSNDLAAERDRIETGNDITGANLHSKRQPAGHDNSDYRRS
jgi:isoquinoline 1-oxidoreductase subunit beta